MLTVVSWVVYARVVRAETLVQREQEFVQAARALGSANGRILLRHVLPNVFPPVIVIATFEFSRMIISEASLSFLGLGVRPGVPSWGSMLADGRQYLATAWWWRPSRDSESRSPCSRSTSSATGCAISSIRA